VNPIYYFQTLIENQFMAVFDNNVGAQDFIIQEDVDGGLSVSHVKTTGRTDKFFFLPM